MSGEDYKYPGDPEKALRDLLHQHVVMRCYINDLEAQIDRLARAILTDAAPGSRVHEEGEEKMPLQLQSHRCGKAAEELRAARILWSSRPQIERLT